ncbi:MAG: DUF2608 domain-containing protein [Parachlamydiales bacterium]|jgi:hypothetical protein
MSIKSFITIALLFFSNLCGIIVETPHFEDLKKYISKDCLVVLDIDDTLLVPVQSLGNDVWFRSRVRYHKELGDSAEVALEKAIAEWEGVRHLTQMKIVEEGTDGIVSEIQNQGFTVIGMTTQGLALSTRTIQQLKSHHIDLSLTAPCPHDHYFMNRLGNLYRKGILFTSGTPKGPSLLKLLDIIDFHPSTVVFINDNGNYLHEVASSLEEKGIQFIGLRYSYSDARIQAFNKDIAEIQWQRSSFARILSDQEALEILEGNK